MKKELTAPAVQALTSLELHQTIGKDTSTSGS